MAVGGWGTFMPYLADCRLDFTVLVVLVFMQARILISSGIALTLIWSGVAAVRAYTDAYVSSPEKVMALIEAAPWRVKGSKPSAGDRQQFLDQVADSAAKLTFYQRTKLRDDHQEDIAFFYMELTDSERQWMAEKTVEPFYKTVLKAFNAMPVDERRKIINGTRMQMRKDGRDIGGLERMAQRDPEFWERMATEGISTTYESASSEEKLILGPLLEELQRRVQGLRR
jgi:hypothetical protein